MKNNLIRNYYWAKLSDQATSYNGTSSFEYGAHPIVISQIPTEAPIAHFDIFDLSENKDMEFIKLKRGVQFCDVIYDDSLFIYIFSKKVFDIYQEDISNASRHFAPINAVKGANIRPYVAVNPLFYNAESYNIDYKNSVFGTVNLRGVLIERNVFCENPVDVEHNLTYIEKNLRFESAQTYMNVRGKDWVNLYMPTQIALKSDFFPLFFKFTTNVTMFRDDFVDFIRKSKAPGLRFVTSPVVAQLSNSSPASF